MRVLQLIAEAVGAAGLVVAAAAPVAGRRGSGRSASRWRARRARDRESPDTRRPGRGSSAPTPLPAPAGRRPGRRSAGSSRRASSASSAAPTTNTISRSCPSASSIWVCSAAHGSSPAPVLPDKRAAVHGGRVGQRAVAADELGAVPGDGPLALAHLREDDPAGPCAGVGIAGEERAAVRILLGHDVHEIGVPPLAQHQLPVAR